MGTSDGIRVADDGLTGEVAESGGSVVESFGCAVESAGGTVTPGVCHRGFAQSHTKGTKTAATSARPRTIFFNPIFFNAYCAKMVY